MASWRSQIATLADALASRPVARYLVEGVMRLPSLNMFYGLPESMKTNLLMDMAICIATQTPWLRPQAGALGPDAHPTLARPVLWVDSDSGSETLHERFGAFARGHGASKRTPIYFCSFLIPPFSSTRMNSIRTMLSLMQDLNIGALFLDNLAALAPGADENTAAMAEVMSHLRFLSERAQAVVTVIHHIPKHGNDRLSPRGHTTIEAALDSAIHVQREEDVVTLTPTKSRHAQIERMAALWTWEHVPGTRQLQSARFWGLEPEADPRRLEVERFVIAFLTQTGPSNQSAVIAAGAGKRISRARIIRALAQCVKTSQIKVQTGAHNQQVYTL